jgi:glycosyltransferase involved in cell wall biosynthesis
MADSTLRKAWKIPKDAFVLGTLSAEDSFDIPFVREWIMDYLKQDSSHFFVCPNVQPFLEHPRARFLRKITSTIEKANYLNSIDLMINARLRGETFGLAIAEALAMGVPAVASSIGVDQNQTQILAPAGWIYSDALELDALVSKLKTSGACTAAVARSLVEGYSPKNVTEKFVRVFLN